MNKHYLSILPSPDKSNFSCDKKDLRADKQSFKQSVLA